MRHNMSDSPQLKSVTPAYEYYNGHLKLGANTNGRGSTLAPGRCHSYAGVQAFCGTGVRFPNASSCNSRPYAIPFPLNCAT